MKSGFGERFRRWLLDEPEPEPAPTLSCPQISECRVREWVEVGGVISHLGINLETDWLEADLQDDSGRVRLIWMGRTSIDCIHEGATIIASGRLAKIDGDLAIYNPAFSVLPV